MPSNIRICHELAFAIVVSVVAGTIFGLAPVWLTSRLHLTATLRREGPGSNGSRQRSRLRHVLVIGELALSLVLMVSAGLLLRSFWDLYKVQLGFNPSRVMAIETWLPVPNDPKAGIHSTATQESVLLREVLRRNRTLPGVEETAVSDRAAISPWPWPERSQQDPVVSRGPGSAEQPASVDRYSDRLPGILPRARHDAPAWTPLRRPGCQRHALDRRHQPEKGHNLRRDKPEKGQNLRTDKQEVY